MYVHVAICATQAAAFGDHGPGAALLADGDGMPTGGSRVLSAAEDCLSHSGSLFGVLGLERFGLTDPAVVTFVGSLPGAECHQGAMTQVSGTGFFFRVSVDFACGVKRIQETQRSISEAGPCFFHIVPPLASMSMVGDVRPCGCLVCFSVCVVCV